MKFGLLTCSRHQRVQAVAQVIAGAFEDWEYPRPSNSPIVTPDFRSEAEQFESLRSVSDWRQLRNKDAGGFLPQWMMSDWWLFYLPGLLLCNEEEERIGFDPVSLGLPPAPPSKHEVLSLGQIATVLTSPQMLAIRDYTELYHWLRWTEKEYSHFEAYWHGESDARGVVPTE